ncbi:MAG: hypothetical protein WC796_02870 [Candidatus Pacearchaeota archaeon]|jgi:NOL1/NOP2/fmu family ribosome biogenesis protein
MVKVEILDRTKKKKVLEILEEAYGIEDLPYMFIKTGKDKVRIFSGEMAWDEINEFSKKVNVEIIGVPLCTFVEDNVTRINFDVANLPSVKNGVTKNIYEIDDAQLGEWLNGKNINVDLEISKKLTSGFVMVSHKGDFIGVGKTREGYIQNYVPKERRVKN